MIVLLQLLIFAPLVVADQWKSTLFPYTTLFRSQVAKRRTKGRLSARLGQAPKAGEDDRLRNRLVRSLLRLRSEEHTSELQSRLHLVCRLLLEKTNPLVCSSLTERS